MKKIWNMYTDADNGRWRHHKGGTSVVDLRCELKKKGISLELREAAYDALRISPYGRFFCEGPSCAVKICWRTV